MTFAYTTGWRVPSEVLPLTWERVDLDEGCVRLDPGTTKNREGRIVYLSSELQAVLEQQRENRRDGCSYVFHRDGQPIKDFRAAWETACTNAGLVGRIPHDLRRTAVRNLVRAGVPERVAMSVSGHRTRSVFERYNIVSDGDLRQAAKRLDAAIGSRTTTTSTTREGGEEQHEELTH